MIASLDVRYYNDPTLLTDAEPIQATATIEDGIVTVQRDLNLLGSIQVRVVATDGIASVERIFHVILN